jgi:NADH-quinone oxidoreductase subunit L
MLIGSLALIGVPGFAGFFSKDAIIEAVQHCELTGAGFAYTCVLLGVFVTALYSFRMFFIVFHGEERMDAHTRAHVRESPWVVTLPLILLAIPSVVAGYYIEPMLFGNFFDGSIKVFAEHNVLGEVAAEYTGIGGFIVHSVEDPPLYLMLAGVISAWFLYLKRPDIPEKIKASAGWLYTLLDRKYYADDINDLVFASGGRRLGGLMWKVGDVTLIDGVMVNGTANTVGWFSTLIRQVQTGYLYHYAFAMIIGLMLMLYWFVLT